MIPFSTCMQLNGGRARRAPASSSSTSSSSAWIIHAHHPQFSANFANVNTDARSNIRIDAENKDGVLSFVWNKVNDNYPSIQINAEMNASNIDENASIKMEDNHEDEAGDYHLRTTRNSIDDEDDASIYTRRRSSSSIRYADDTDTGTDILMITEEGFDDILVDPTEPISGDTSISTTIAATVKFSPSTKSKSEYSYDTSYKVCYQKTNNNNNNSNHHQHHLNNFNINRTSTSNNNILSNNNNNNNNNNNKSITNKKAIEISSTATSTQQLMKTSNLKRYRNIIEVRTVNLAPFSSLSLYDYRYYMDDDDNLLHDEQHKSIPLLSSSSSASDEEDDDDDDDAANKRIAIYESYYRSELHLRGRRQSAFVRDTNELLDVLRKRKNLIRNLRLDSKALLDHSYCGIIKRFLLNSSNWGFNSFTFDTLTGGHSLSYLLLYLFKKYNFIRIFNLDILNLWKLFHLFENGYHDTNPYHNSVHASDVTQAMHCFIEENKIGPYLTPMEKMCSLLAAVAHDLDHPGVTQHFLIATNNHLAALYNNLSVLESHHWRFAISCIKESQLFDHFDLEQWSEVNHLLSSLILATDITQQSSYINRFRLYLNEPNQFHMSSKVNRLFILQIALKCADLGNPCRPWTLSYQWAKQICAEFYKQGDYERLLHLPVTPICDRRRASIAAIQTDFFRNVVSPLFQLWDQFLSSQLSRRLINNLEFNNSQWESSAYMGQNRIERRHTLMVFDFDRTKETDAITDDDDDDHVDADRPKRRSMRKIGQFDRSRTGEIFLRSLNNLCDIDPEIKFNLDEYKDFAMKLTNKLSLKVNCDGKNGCGTPTIDINSALNLDRLEAINHDDQGDHRGEMVDDDDVQKSQKQDISPDEDVDDDGDREEEEENDCDGGGRNKRMKDNVEVKFDLDTSMDDIANLQSSLSASQFQPMPAQSFYDTAQYMTGRRGSAPGCIGVYGELAAAAALVLIHGAVKSKHQQHNFHQHYQQQQQQQDDQEEKRRSSFPIERKNRSFAANLNTRAKNSSSFKQKQTKKNVKLLNVPQPFGTSAGKYGLRGGSLEVLMSSLNERNMNLSRQACSLDSGAEFRQWYMTGKPRRGSVPQDILIDSLTKFSSQEGL